MYQYPSDIKGIKSRIRNYELALKKEYQTSGFYDDSYGKRYMLGLLYLLSGNFQGALKSFEWFEGTFPDDSGEPYQYLCWILALYKTGDKNKARKKMIEIMFMNIYLIPHILGIEQPKLLTWHGSNLEQKLYASEYPTELIKLWDVEAIEWLKAEWLNP